MGKNRTLLRDLEAHFVTDKAERKIALTFLCPKCRLHYHCIPFKNPIGSGEAATDWAKTFWNREGETIDTLTLKPSILNRQDPPPKPNSCKFHLWITAGAVEDAE